MLVLEKKKIMKNWSFKIGCRPLTSVRAQERWSTPDADSMSVSEPGALAGFRAALHLRIRPRNECSFRSIIVGFLLIDPSN